MTTRGSRHTSAAQPPVASASRACRRDAARCAARRRGRSRAARRRPRRPARPRRRRRCAPRRHGSRRRTPRRPRARPSWRGARRMPRLLGARARRASRRRTSGSASAAHPLRHRQRQHLAPARQAVEDEPGEERQPDAHRVRQREGDDAAALLGGDVGGRQLRLVAGGVERRHAEHVPVQRPVGGGRQRRPAARRSSSVNPAMQPARTHSRVVPGGRPHGGGEGDELARWSRDRDGTGSPSPSLWVGAVDVEKPSAPASHASVTSAGHRLDLLGGGRLVAAVAHHRAAHRRVADEEPGVHADGALEAGRPVGRSSASPRRGRPRARRAACPRPGPSSA